MDGSGRLKVLFEVQLLPAGGPRAARHGCFPLTSILYSVHGVSSASLTLGEAHSEMTRRSSTHGSDGHRSKLKGAKKVERRTMRRELKLIFSNRNTVSLQ